MINLWRAPSRQSIKRIAGGQPLQNDADTQPWIALAV
jgi:hypothetical protein